MVNGPMGGFMGTPPAPAQPPQVNFTTTAESRGGFNNFLKSMPNTTAMTPLPPMGSPSMMPAPNPMGNIDIFNEPMGMQFGGVAGNPLSGYGDYLSQQIDNTQVEPFIQEVEQMANDRFNLGSDSGGLKTFLEPTIFEPPQQQDMMARPPSLFQRPAAPFQMQGLGQPMRDKDGILREPMGLRGGPQMFNLDQQIFNDGIMPGNTYLTGSRQFESAKPLMGSLPRTYADGGDVQNFFSGGEIDSFVDEQDSGNNFSGGNNDDDSDPDSDMDYTDSYDTKEDQEDDFSSATEIGRAVAKAQAAANEVQLRGLGGQNKATINQAINQNKANQKSLIDNQLSLSPSESDTKTVTTNNQPRGSDVDRDAVQAAATSLGTSQTNVPNDLNLDLDLGLNLPVDFEEKVGRDFNANRMADIERLYGEDVGQTKAGRGTDPTLLEGLGVPTPATIFGDVIERKSRENMANEIALGRPMGLGETLFGYKAPNFETQTMKDYMSNVQPNYDFGDFNQTSRSIPEKQFIRNDSGRVIGIRDESGRLVSGTDPNAEIPIGDDNDNPFIRKLPILKTEKEEEDKPPNVIGGGDPIAPITPKSVVVDSPFTSNVGDFTPSSFDVGDLNKLIEAITGVSGPQSMEKGGVAGYAGGGLISAVDNFLASV